MNTLARISITCLTVLTSTTAIASTGHLEALLESVGSYYADGGGQISITLEETDEVKVMAQDVDGYFSIYQLGDVVPEGAVLAACSVDAAGAPYDCDEAYDDSVLYGLEYFQDDQPDPDELKINCTNLGAGDAFCNITWDNGRTSCIKCIGNSCHTSCNTGT